MEIFIIISLLILVLILLLNISKANTETGKVRQMLKSANDQWQESINANKRLQLEKEKIEAENTALSVYGGILDADTKAKEILQQAQQDYNAALANAKLEAEGILKESKEFRIKQRQDAELKIAKATATLNDATKQAQQIIEGAHKKAMEIGGNAYKALQNAEMYEDTVLAMKNIINGYGDKYIIPTFTLLDELAEGYSHTEAGKQLQESRELMRRMIDNGTAATCEYVEEIRRTTAINFVLDAFNGKVDSILSMVKKDNYGVLMQKIKDAYTIVNFNGKAFRNAFITEAYLEIRLQELKWAVVVQELKWNEKEEQRLIKEQIREEEKARRDFEKAIKEAQKEEDLLNRAIEKAKLQLAGANEVQKAKYEQQLNELNERLTVAEEKNKRALSMAQQTKSGNVYVISNIGSFGEHVYKIGMTRRLEPLDRIRELGDASVPFEFDVHSLIYSEDAPALERQLHKAFLRMQMNKVNPRKEFFKIGLQEIRNEIEKLGIEGKWTMTAEARQYKESLAIEEAITKDDSKMKEWEVAQLQMDPVVEEEAYSL